MPFPCRALNLMIFSDTSSPPLTKWRECLPPVGGAREKRPHKDFLRKAAESSARLGTGPGMSVNTFYFDMLAMVAIMAAMLDMLEPRLMNSAALILRENFVGTTISQPGSTLAPRLTLPTMPFI